ncbi:MAG: hypothetical protein NW224_07400 [Leptolyngbyaceae cyanobacterium bins.302]|nr:hypothetical protein [Leptolyngbyaceae cyanobacterium bins.302]
MSCINPLIFAQKLLVSSVVSSLILIAVPGWASPKPFAARSAQDLQPVLPSGDLAIVSNMQLELMDGRSPEDTTTVAQATVTQTTDTQPSATQAPGKLESTDLLDNSPVFQRWNQEVPNVLEEIKRDPAFRTRVRLGLSYFPSTFDSLGWNVGVEDVFVGRTNLTVSGDYQATFTGDRQAGGGELRYYLLPLGSYFNIAPVLGYRYLETPRYSTDGLNVGAKFQAVLSRTGGADISFTQTWVGPRQSDEVGISKFSFGYALTKNLRLSTDIEKQNSKQKKDTRFGVSFEWMF